MRALAVTAADARQQFARIAPFDGKSCPCQVPGTNARRHEFAQCHDTHAHAHTDFTNQPHAGNKLLQFVNCGFEHLRTVQAEVCRELVMLFANLLEPVRGFAGRSATQDLLEAVRDASQCRMDDDGF